MNPHAISQILPIPMLWLTCCAAPPTERVPQSPMERQMIGLLEKFDRWDLDGNGKLTLAELSDAERISGIPAQDILKFYDTNQDGAITLREAQAAYQRRIEQRP